MSFAKVVVGLPIEGTFDYLVSGQESQKLKIGCRVKVSFGSRKLTGYVVAITKQSRIKKIKPILEIIDEQPLLDKNMLFLAQELAQYYCCSWGEAIESTIPLALRKGKKVTFSSAITVSDRKTSSPGEVILLHSQQVDQRWQFYLEQIKAMLASGKSAIFILPDIDKLLNAKEFVSRHFTSGVQALYRRQKDELNNWLEIRQGKAKIVIGTRSSVFAPLNDLGLIILEEEENFVYKQDQVPHYHARQICLMRSRLEGAKVILGSRAPSLESLYAAKTTKDYRYIFLQPRQKLPEIKILDLHQARAFGRRKNPVLFPYLEDAIASTVNSGGKALLFLNRSGFATIASCSSCGAVLKCQRCNMNLVYHFKEGLLRCHYCVFKLPLPNLCPVCNAGYIKYSGMGTEKMESELARIFPATKIKRLDDEQGCKAEEAGIFIATQAVLKEKTCRFDLVAVLGIDQALNRIDFRAAEKAFSLLIGLSGFTEKRMIIQTRHPQHYCFQALEKQDWQLFFDGELKHRRQLKFPPFRHLGVVKVRGKIETRVKDAAEGLFSKLSNLKRQKLLEVISLNPGQPAKLRSNYYWQILLSAKDAVQLTKFLKLNLKDFRSSGIIVTVDIDPI